MCHLQHKLIGFYNQDEKCLQRGTDWVFKSSSLRLVCKGLKGLTNTLWYLYHSYYWCCYVRPTFQATHQCNRQYTEYDVLVPLGLGGHIRCRTFTQKHAIPVCMALTRAQVSYENAQYRWENELNGVYTAEKVKT